MKKILALSLVAIFILYGCSNADESQAEQDSPSSIQEEQQIDDEDSRDSENDGGISVNEGLIDVELTLPASLIGDEFDGELDDEDRARGFKSVRINDDGSATFTISRSDYNKLLEETRNDIRQTVSEMANDFESIVEVSINESFTEAEMLVNRAQYEESFDSFAAFGLYLQVAIYQAFEGKTEGDMQLTVYIKDVETGEIFDTNIYPDSLGL